ncbi:unnamed protein product [Rhodiola kirilowii]
MRWLSSSSVRSLKQRQFRLPSALSSNSGGDYFKTQSCLSSSSTVGMATVSGYPKSNYVEGYIEDIQSQKRKSFRGFLPDSIGLSRLMNSYSKIRCTRYGFGVLGLILKWGYTPHVIGINILMNALCEQLRINDATFLFQKLKTQFSCKPDIVTYRTLLKGLCLTGNSRIALNLHEQIADGTHDLSGDLQLDARCYNTLIDGLCKDGLIDKANELLLEMRKKDISPDVITYNIVIDGLHRAGKWEESQAMFREMLDQGLSPSVVTYNVLINALAKMGKSKEAKELFSLMLQSGQMPTVVTYNSLMDCFYREGNIEELKEVFVFMGRKGITANVVTYNILIKGYCKLGMIDEANAECRRMIQNRVKPDIITINALLEGMLLKGMVSEAIELKREITVHNLTPNTCTYNILVDGFCKNGYIQEAEKLFDMMSGSKLKPDVVTYNCLITGLCKVGKLEKALLLFDRMSCDCVVPNCRTYNIRIDGLCKAEKYVEAEKLFDMMSGSKLKPNVVTYSSLIDGLCKAGKLEKANELFLEMRKKDISPDVITYNIVIGVLCRAGKWEEAKAMSREMLDHGHEPSVVTFNVLINALAKMGKSKEAKELEGNIEELKDVFVSMDRNAIDEYRRMVHKGLKPDIITINALLEGMLLKGMVSEAIELKSEITVHNLTPDMCTYNILVDGFCKNDYIQEAEKLFDMMSGSKLKPNVVTYNSLIDGLCKAGKLEMALLLFDGMSSDGVVPDGHTYTILIDGLCKAVKLIEAEKLFVDMGKNGLLPNVYTFGALFMAFARSATLVKKRIIMNMLTFFQLSLKEGDQQFTNPCLKKISGIWWAQPHSKSVFDGSGLLVSISRTRQNIKNTPLEPSKDMPLDVITEFVRQAKTAKKCEDFSSTCAGFLTWPPAPPRPDLTQTVATLGPLDCSLKLGNWLVLAEVYGHKIYQYLENLLTPLSNITNEDRIVAYRLPKLSGLTRLEIIHQYHGKYVSDSFRSGERKLLGSPLVTYLNDDCLSGAGIDRCVTRVLLPLKRSATKSQCNKENALLPAEINTEIDSLGSQSITQSTVDEKDDEMFDSELTFHLCLVDSGGKVSSPLKADTLIRPDYDYNVMDYDRNAMDYELDATDYERDATDYERDATYYDHDATNYKYPV